MDKMRQYKNEMRGVGVVCKCREHLYATVYVLGSGEWSKTRVKCCKCGRVIEVSSRVANGVVEVEERAV